MTERFPSNYNAPTFRLEDTEQQNESGEIPEEVRLELSELFVQELRQAKERLRESEPIIGSDERVLAYSRLAMFSGALQQLALHPSVPDPISLRLKALDINLWPSNRDDISSYGSSVETALNTLSVLLTPDAMLALQEHLPDIFIPPAEQALEK